jgi:alkaline phosphatase
MEYEIDRAQVSDQPRYAHCFSVLIRRYNVCKCTCMVCCTSPNNSLTEILKPLFEQLAISANRGGPGFITMIEGSRVDHAGHSLHPATSFTWHHSSHLTKYILLK